MNIEVRVVPGAKKREITREGQAFKVKLLSPAREGKANKELVEYLADFFSVRKSEIVIVLGERDRRKVVSLPIGPAALAALSPSR